MLELILKRKKKIHINHHLEIQMVTVEVLNPSKCLLKLYECSQCPDQNKT